MGIRTFFEELFNKLHSAIREQVQAFLCIVLFFAVCYLIVDISKITTLQYIYDLIRLTSELAVWFVCGNLIHGLYTLIKERKIKDFKIRCIWFVILLVVSLPYIPKLFGYSSTQIGDFYEASTYTENYVVFMSREPETNENRKTYILSAQISRFREELGSETHTDYVTGERSEKPIIKLCYHIDKLYFSNGGYIDFTEVESHLSMLELDVETEVRDKKGNDYYIKLTSQKSK